MDTFDNHHNPTAVSATPDRWTPILKGEVFCSPACGFKCKKVDYDRAVEAANALSTMMGRGWETEVWENAGWHYVVRKGCGEVRYDGDEFKAAIRLEPNEVISETASNPRQAMDLALKVLNEKIAKLTRVCSSLALEPLEIEDRTGDH